MSALGEPVARKDGPLKVTGTATYAADHRIPKLTHAAVVQSTIAKGTIREIDTKKAAGAPGVLAILTHENTPRLVPLTEYSNEGEYSEHHHPLQDNQIYFNGQYVALVVAETWEQARDAANMIRVSYDPVTPAIDLDANEGSATAPESFYKRDNLQVERGNTAEGLNRADVKIEAVYRTPLQHNNALEPHATIASWEGGKLTLYETTQWLAGMQSVVSKSLGIPAEQVHVISPFVGGGFGCKGFVWPHSVLAAVAARQVQRPVKLVVRRQEMFSSVGHRGRTRQEIALGATKDGKLTALSTKTLTETSIWGHHMEPAGVGQSILYACPNLTMTHHVAKLNLDSPAPMRAPGEAPGTFALESAMDELAVKLGMDPVELRVRNHADQDPEKERPWTSKHLLECYEHGTRKFGWEKRDPKPRSMRAGRMLAGWGMATALYPAGQRPGTATVKVLPDGSALVETASHDLGTGTYTSLAQIAASELGIPVERVRCHIGDSALPKAGVSGGSTTSASIGPAVQMAAREAKTKGVGFGETKQVDPKEQKKTSYSFGAHFVEVHVDPDLGHVRVTRVVSVMDIGRVINRKTATSQIRGGVIWGLSLALLERSLVDTRQGRMVTRNLADYLIPVNADSPNIEVEFLDIPDYEFNSLGVRGIGEIGITGSGAAVANAVYHATGIRVRDLPITVEKLL